MDLQEQKKFIQLKEVIRKKSPNFAKWIPEPLFRYLKRIIHEDEINYIMRTYHDKFGLDFVDSLLKELNVTVYLEGVENIPVEENVIFASNHPLGGLDGVAFMQAIGKYKKNVKFLVNDILMNVSNLEPLFVPVNKLGEQSKSGVMAIENAYASDQALLVFPAGLVSRKRNGKIVDLEWKKSFINKAKKYKKDIVPVYIEGRNSNFFYNLARIRTWLGIKANIEMLYLPDEMFSQRGKRITIRIGKKIPYTTFDKRNNERQWAAIVKNMVYSIADGKK